jgi:chromosome segregation ATPase
MTIVVVGELFNAVAFAGAGFLFSKLNHSGYEDEMKRHNKALEKLTKAKEKLYESQVEKKNRIAILRQEIVDAKSDMEATNRALDSLRKAQEELTLDEEPTIHDYYKPSSEMEEYQQITIGILGLGSGFIITKLL